jgi:hypothetical protein
MAIVADKGADYPYPGGYSRGPYWNNGRGYGYVSGVGLDGGNDRQQGGYERD